jgi:protease-4
MTAKMGSARASLRPRTTLGLALGLACVLGLPREAAAGNGGESRSLLRDADRPYGVVAGEADASAVVQNPANLAYLAGFNAIVDFAASLRTSGRRGDGIGVFAAVPLPWQILALGVGVQAMWRTQVTDDGTYPSGDDPFGKFTLAAAVPLMRWVPGLSVGLQYSRLFTGTNALLQGGVSQFDLALSWRANRYLSLAMVARNLNAPRLAGRVPPVLDPEIALRPFGDSRLEFAFGIQAATGSGSCTNRAEAQIKPMCVQPRGRVLFGTKGVRLYAEAEGMTYFRSEYDPQQDMETVAVQPELALRISAGLQFDTPHFGLTAGPTFGAGTNLDGPHGVNGRLRFSHERYNDVLPMRPRQVTRISLAGKRDDRDLADVVWTIDELAQRRGGVILVEVRGTGFGTAQLEEVRSALQRFADNGGKIAVYLDGGGLSQYFLASVADRIVAHPHTALSIIGLSSRTLYWGELLARLGIVAEFVRIAEYKGTPEVWSQAGPSAPVAEANRTYMTDVWNHLVRVIGLARARDPSVVSGWVDAAPWQPEDARKSGLVDDIAWPDELDAKLEDWLGRRVRIEPPPKAPVRNGDPFGAPGAPGDWETPAHVAVLHVSGSLVAGESLSIPLLRLKLAGSETLTKQIEQLREDRDVKAVVVRIDSRGGSVRAAQEIARELERTREHKPVVISMGEVAASGGYYIATGGQYIFADATTLTGSIGIFYPKLDLSGLLDKVGAHAELLSIGDRATMRSYWKPYSDDEREAAMAGIQASYDVFIERVAAARSMTPEAADAVARGRLWSGVRAIEVGLVDRYGGLRDAVDRAARMAELAVVAGAAPPIRHYPPPPSILQQIRSLFGVNLGLPLGLSGSPPGRGGATAVVDPLTGSALSFADPILRTLRLLPAALWYGSGPEALAIAPAHLEIEG